MITVAIAAYREINREIEGGREQPQQLVITRDHLAPFIGDTTDFLPQDVSDRWKAPLAEQHPHVTGVQKGKKKI